MKRLDGLLPFRGSGQMLQFFRKRPQSIRSFSSDKLHCKKGGFPYVSSKGSDILLLYLWPIFVCNLKLRALEGHDPSVLALLQAMIEGAEQGVFFTKTIHRHGLWIQKGCVKKLTRAWQMFLYRYAFLANESMESRAIRHGSEVPCILPLQSRP